MTWYGIQSYGIQSYDMGFNHIQNCITLDNDETIGLRDTDIK